MIFNTLFVVNIISTLFVSNCQSVAKFSGGSQNTFAFNVAVGKKPTNADFYVEEASSVTDVLVKLSGEKVSARMNSGSSEVSDEHFS